MESKPFRRVYGVSGGYHCARRARRDLSRIAHAHARNPDESRRRPSTPMACICVNELKRFLSGDFWLHHSVMTYSFVTQPASSTSYADYTRRLTYRRSKVTVGRAAGLQRFRNASSFSRPAFPTQGTRGQKSGRQSVAENPFAHAEARMACKYHFKPLRRFSAALLVFSDDRKGHSQARPSPDAGGWRSDGTAECDGAERTYCRRVRAMLVADPAGDLLSLRPCGLGSGPFSWVGSTLAAHDHRDERRGSCLRSPLECPQAVAGWHAILPYGPGRGVDRAAGAAWQSPPRDIINGPPMLPNAH